MIVWYHNGGRRGWAILTWRLSLGPKSANLCIEAVTLSICMAGAELISGLLMALRLLVRVDEEF